MTRGKRDQSNKSRRSPKSTKPIKQPKLLQQTQTPPVPEKQIQKWPFLRKIRRWIYIFVFVLIPTLISYFYFCPRVSIQETTLLNPGNPFFYPFIVKNSGNINVIDFSYYLGIEKITYKGGGSIKGGSIVRVTDSTRKQIRDTIPKIKKEGTHPIDLSFFIGADPFFIDSAIIFVNFKYSAPILKFHFSDNTKFVLFKDGFNNYHWKEYQF